MSETRVERDNKRLFKARYRGRIAQTGIYLARLLAMFMYQSDWKVLPMAALIAGLVGMVIRNRLFITMEGTLLGGFAMVMVCIWNGCFNSIQVICRERDVIKREHRSGMHISSYVVSHMLYQALLCLLQTVVTLYVTKAVGVKYPTKGLFTGSMIVDFGISVFLITYASDMMALWISSLARNTTTAMTIMPFVLIFQLVFSGGMLTLPKWSKPLTYLTISNPGLKVIAAQSDVNHQPYATIADLVKKMKDDRIDVTVTVGQIMDMLESKDNKTVDMIRGQVLLPTMTLGQLKATLDNSATVAAHRDDPITNHLTLGNVLDMVEASGLWEKNKNEVITKDTTIGDLVDLVAKNPDFQEHRDKKIDMPATVGDLLNLVGEDKVMKFLEEKAAAANFKAEYEYSVENVVSYWMTLLLFIFVFAALSTITLEFIDKDKR